MSRSVVISSSRSPSEVRRSAARPAAVESPSVAASARSRPAAASCPEVASSRPRGLGSTVGEARRLEQLGVVGAEGRHAGGMFAGVGGGLEPDRCEVTVAIVELGTAAFELPRSNEPATPARSVRSPLRGPPTRPRSPRASPQRRRRPPQPSTRSDAAADDARRDSCCSPSQAIDGVAASTRARTADRPPHVACAGEPGGERCRADPAPRWLIRRSRSDVAEAADSVRSDRRLPVGRTWQRCSSPVGSPSSSRTHGSRVRPCESLLERRSPSGGPRRPIARRSTATPPVSAAAG